MINGHRRGGVGGEGIRSGQREGSLIRAIRIHPRSYAQEFRWPQTNERKNGGAAWEHAGTDEGGKG